jgi:hypothetical protein
VKKSLVTFPRLFASATLESDLQPIEVVNIIGKALGIEFSKDEEGIYEEMNALVSYTFGHVFAVYQERDRQTGQHIAVLIVELQRDLGPTDIGYRLSDCEIIDLQIDEYFAALLRTQTGLPFEANPPKKRLSDNN